MNRVVRLTAAVSNQICVVVTSATRDQHVTSSRAKQRTDAQVDMLTLPVLYFRIKRFSCRRRAAYSNTCAVVLVHVCVRDARNSCLDHVPPVYYVLSQVLLSSSIVL